MPASDDRAPPAANKRKLTHAAERALAEAAARRGAARGPTAGPKEVPEREGPDPTRYGDWENKGLASDF